MKQLDKSKPFGIICGVHDASFVQDGAYFDAEGNELGAEQEEVEKVLTPAEKRAATWAAKKAAGETVAEPTIDPELDAQINANLQG
jgi:hypothetical protein